MIHFDQEQQCVITAQGGHWLVLAPPGCGKTETLAHRVRHAHTELGVPYDDMLCLTFTNRAARGMRDRIGQEAIADTDADNLFVGNIHRFCARFLQYPDHALVHPDTNIIDENDFADILDQLGLTKDAVTYRLSAEDGNPLGLADVSGEVLHLEHYLGQVMSGHEAAVWLHDCGLALGKYFSLFGIEYAVSKTANCIMLLMQRFAGQTYAESKRLILQWLKERPADGNLRCYCLYTCILMGALDYARYKRQNHLMDFDDILCRTYDALCEPDYRERYLYTAYHWIQIDEVQDLNPLQLAIVNRITAAEDATVVYLGDEQQAIFSFMGAQLGNLQALMSRCRGHVIRLRRNHRSPRYLLDIFNTYATRELGIPPELLPSTDDTTPPAPADVVLRGYEYYAQVTSKGLPYSPAARVPQQLESVPAMVRYYMGQSPNDSVAVIVTTNQQADDVAACLEREGIACFRISGQDSFRQMDFKTLLAHFTVLEHDQSFIEWARLLHRAAGVSFSDARQAVRRMREVALSPADLLLCPGTSAVGQFCRMYASQEFIIFDTETTGLDVEQDDIVQIAAVTVRDGEVVAGSELDIILHTDLPIPPCLGDIDNPLTVEYARRVHTPRAEGLRRFLDYVGERPVLGHNVGFDYAILRHNVRRELGREFSAWPAGGVWDSLALARLLLPSQKVFKLKTLLSDLGLEGENSHLAGDDILATLSLVRHLYDRGEAMLPAQRALLADATLAHMANRFTNVYGGIYRAALADLDDDVALSDALREAHGRLCAVGMTAPVPHFDYICRFVAVRTEGLHCGTLRARLAAVLGEMRTYSEADLCEADLVSERVYVLTVHKAKGLEFDNVIVFDAVKGRYPFFGNVYPQQDQEDARCFYVAMSRARRRLCVTWARNWVWEGESRRGHAVVAMPKTLTPFMSTIQSYFRVKDS